MSKQKMVILYERLSRDDGDDISNSIVNQMAYLEGKAKENGFYSFRHIQDDGYSGAIWARPGWKELIAEVEADNVGVIITKKLDRIGRDYLRVGLYLEMFAERGIRLIIPGDGIDTMNGEDAFTPFRAIMAEWYARDCSVKIRTMLKSRMSAGFHCTGSIPYGYARTGS